jgi:hypothetical protein
LTDLYAASGAIFSGPGGNNGGAILDQAGRFGVNARSGESFLAFNRVGAAMLDGSLPIDPEAITFATLVTDVSIWASGGAETASFLMEAFDAADALVGTSTVTAVHRDAERRLPPAEREPAGPSVERNGFEPATLIPQLGKASEGQ